MKPKALVFDMDGTLLDTLNDLSTATNQALKQHGFDSHPVNAYRHFVGSGARELVRRALPAATKENTAIIDACLASFNEWYQAHWNTQTQLYDGIAELLNFACEQNLKIAVLTNKPQAFAVQCQQAFLDNWPLTCVQGQQPGLALKPAAEISARVTQALAVEPAEVWYFGDSDVDMQTALNAGYRAIGVTWGFRSAEELLAAGADKLVDHPREIIALLTP